MSLLTSPRSRVEKFRRLNSVMLVDEIEPSLEFWVDRLGFEVRLKVTNDEGRPEFAIFGQDAIEVVYRTKESLNRGTPGLMECDDRQPLAILYLQVADLDSLLPHLEGVETVIPLRENAIGSREIFVREPSGRIVALTQQS